MGRSTTHTITLACNLRFSACLVVNAVSSKERVEPKIEVMPAQTIPRSEANRLRLAQRLAER